VLLMPALKFYERDLRQWKPTFFGFGPEVVVAAAFCIIFGDTMIRFH
jgi:hypothetical protein